MQNIMPATKGSSYLITKRDLIEMLKPFDDSDRIAMEGENGDEIHIARCRQENGQIVITPNELPAIPSAR